MIFLPIGSVPSVVDPHRSTTASFWSIDGAVIMLQLQKKLQRKGKLLKPTYWEISH